MGNNKRKEGVYLKIKDNFEQARFEKAVRYTPGIQSGLTEKQVAERYANRLRNYNKTVKTKSRTKIIFENTVTLFNMVNIIIAFFLIYVGSYKNTAFIGVIFFNTIIGVVQELRAKLVTDRLSFVTQATAAVVRGGEVREIAADEIVLDDLVIFNPGNQICADCVIMSGSCEVDESFVTGESEPVVKNPGDILLAGSFMVSGSCRSRADKVAGMTYISSISKNAKLIKAPDSVFIRNIKRLITIISIAIFPIGILSFISNYNQSGRDLTQAVEATAGALIAMIPQGLMLLTSSALALSIVRLAKKKVLTADLYCIEMLARADTVCLDKTGTLTEGKMTLAEIVDLDKGKKNHFYLSALAKALGPENATMAAIIEKYKLETDLICTGTVPFSSKTKWSGAEFGDFGSLAAGAPEYLCPGNFEILTKSEEYGKEYRVLLLVKIKGGIISGETPENAEPLALLLLKDRIRPQAAGFIEYLKRQEVDIKIISGDNPMTVSEIARKTGIDNSDKYIDCSKIANEEALEEAAVKYTVFGRVTPFQKKILISALKKHKRTVAMTGDGVNDILAMKEADCSVAMGSGTDAARNVAKIVLLESDFNALPAVIAEGRRTVNNIERSAAFFLTKTMYSFLLAVILLLIGERYPFVPIQQTLIGLTGIGIPSLVLAFQPNRKRISNGFVKRVLFTAAPAAITITAAASIFLKINQKLSVTENEANTILMISSGIVFILLITSICYPPNKLEKLLILGVSGILAFGVLFFKKTLEISKMDLRALLLLLTTALLSALIFIGLTKAAKYFLSKPKN